MARRRSSRRKKGLSLPVPSAGGLRIGVSGVRLTVPTGGAGVANPFNALKPKRQSDFLSMPPVRVLEPAVKGRVGVRSSLPRYRPHSVLEDVWLTGGEYRRIAETVRQAAGARAEAEKRLAEMSLASGVDVKTLSRIGEKVYVAGLSWEALSPRDKLVLAKVANALGESVEVDAHGNPLKEEDKATLMRIAGMLAEAYESRSREAAAIDLREWEERYLSYKRQNFDEVFDENVKRFKGLLKTLPARAKEAKEKVEEVAERVEPVASKLAQALPRKSPESMITSPPPPPPQPPPQPPPPPPQPKPSRLSGLKARLKGVEERARLEASIAREFFTKYLPARLRGKVRNVDEYMPPYDEGVTGDVAGE